MAITAGNNLETTATTGNTFDPDNGTDTAVCWAFGVIDSASASWTFSGHEHGSGNNLSFGQDDIDLQAPASPEAGGFVMCGARGDNVASADLAVTLDTGDNSARGGWAQAFFGANQTTSVNDGDQNTGADASSAANLASVTVNAGGAMFYAMHTMNSGTFTAPAEGTGTWVFLGNATIQKNAANTDLGAWYLLSTSGETVGVGATHSTTQDFWHAVICLDPAAAGSGPDTPRGLSWIHRGFSPQRSSSLGGELH